MEGQFVMVFLVAFIPIIYGQHNVTMGKIVVDGATTIAKTDENYICMTIDYWPFNECSKIPCLWDGNASVLNLNLSLPTLTKAVQAFKTLRIRVGGSLQDKLIYDIGSFKGNNNCPQFARDSNEMFQITEGCLSMERWDDLNQFFNKTGAIVTFGLNALLGRHPTIGMLWEGDWNYTNAEDLIQYTIEKNYHIDSWEFGNEMVGHNSIGANITAAQYAKDLIKLREIIDRLYNKSQQKPLIVAPSAFFDVPWFEDFVNKTGPGVVDVFTHHIYNMGAGDDPKIIHRFVDPNYLSQESSVFQQLENIVQIHAPWSVPWVGEAGGSYRGGSPNISNTFIDGFWYLDQLAMAALYNTKVYCRQTLVGGHYGVLLPHTLAPSPDYYGALLFHQLMGPGILKVDNNVSSYLRTYAHCTKRRSGVTMLFINLSNQTEFRIEIEKKMNESLANNPAQREEYHLTPSNGLGVVDEALRLMKQMEGSGYFPNVFTYTILIDGFLNAKRADEAFTVLQTMKEKNVVPNAATMRSLVHGVFRCMAPDKAFELLLEFVEKKQRVSQLVGDNILYCLSNNSMASEAVMFLSKIGKKGYVPDNSIFNVTLACVLKKLDLKETCNVFDNCVQRGVKPGFSTYLTLIEALYKAGKMEIGNQYMDRIINDGLISSVYSYNMVIDCLCKGKLMDRALEIFRDLHYKGISPNVVTYNTLISGYCRNGNMEKAQELLEMLLDCRFKPDIFTFNSLIDGLCQAHKHEDAFGCFTEMVEWDVTPDAITYNILIRSFCVIGDVSRSTHLLREMKLHGIQPDTFSFNALIQSYFRMTGFRKLRSFLIQC